MSVESLVQRFQRARKQELVDDELLLTH